jgi:hemerythrin superfamily protein
MTDILADDHAEVNELLRDLSAAFDGGSVRELFEKLDYLWARLAVHIRAEHLHLFPALLAAAAEKRDEERGGAPASSEVGATVERLREDHDFFMRELAAAVNSARELITRDGRQDGERLSEIEGSVAAVAARLAEHNGVEEERLYRWPEALLSEAELEALSALMRRELENLPPRFSER